MASSDELLSSELDEGWGFAFANTLARIALDLVLLLFVSLSLLQSLLSLLPPSLSSVLSSHGLSLLILLLPIAEEAFFLVAGATFNFRILVEVSGVGLEFTASRSTFRFFGFFVCGALKKYLYNTACSKKGFMNFIFSEKQTPLRAKIAILPFHYANWLVLTFLQVPFFSNWRVAWV